MRERSFYIRKEVQNHGKGGIKLNQDEMYEEFGLKKDYEGITCCCCNDTFGFSYGNIDAVHETTVFLCKKCKEKLP